eukprot:TRINITY_DN4433_c0_g1_i2.p1 TRINITY_DN4433_c0_g1~~TRINITY_DN4433_c0_g1_i2.p1  ORF type:complete len:852 (+),score=208.33 TRINITY_DN4433_c0_g1_i2:77-2632(+)
MIRRPPRSTLSSSSAASDVYKRQYQRRVRGTREREHSMDSSDDDCLLMAPGSGLGDAMAAGLAAGAMVSEVHAALVLLRPDCEAEVGDALQDVIHLLLAGDYPGVLRSETAIDLLGEADCGTVKRKAEAMVNVSGWEGELLVGCVGIAAVCLFARANLVGPEVDPVELPPWAALWEVVSVDQDSEEVSCCAQFPQLLAAGLAILEGCEELFDEAEMVCCWWKIRAVRIQILCLEGSSGTLFEKQQVSRARLKDLIKDEPENATTDKLKVHLHLEAALDLSEYHQEAQASAQLLSAQKLLGLDLDLEGVLGKRLHSQETLLPQLMLSVTRTGAAPLIVEHPGCPMPTNVMLQESNLLEAPVLEGASPEGDPALSLEEQATLLAALELRMKILPSDATGSDASGTNLSTEEFRPFVERVLATNGSEKSWTVQTVALIHRSLLERSRPKTVERALLQLESLELSFKGGDGAEAADRLRGWWLVAVRPIWRLMKILADGYLQMGVSRSALEIYTRIGDLPARIDCLITLNEHARAEQLIKERLEVAPTAGLYCMLGETTGNLEHFKAGWEHSGRRHAKCMRLLGMWYFQQKNWELAVECFNKSLAISRWHPRAWFALGCAHSNLEAFDPAASAFLKACHQVPHDGEAWNNLAGVYLKSGKKRQAFKAFEEATKFIRRDPRVWQNFMYCAMELREFQRALFILGRIVGMDAPSIDVDAFEFITFVLTESMDTALRRAYVQFVHQVSQTRYVNHPVMWGSIAKYHETSGHLDEGIEARLKQARCLMALSWKNDPPLFEMIADCAGKLVEAWKDKADAESLNLARLHLRGIVDHQDAVEVYHQNEHYLQLTQLLASLD